MVKNITCIRHGHPEQTVLGDPILSINGIEQANYLTGEYDLIILSPLRRVFNSCLITLEKKYLFLMHIMNI